MGLPVPAAVLQEPSLHRTVPEDQFSELAPLEVLSLTSTDLLNVKYSWDRIIRLEGVLASQKSSDKSLNSRFTNSSANIAELSRTAYIAIQ
jgi:hypothetical protein